MNIRIEKSTANGTITAPPSKSASHRLLICAGMSRQESLIRGLEFSGDVFATAECLKHMGVQLFGSDPCRIMGINPSALDCPVWADCGESATTLRLLIPLLLLGRGGGRLTGHGRLMERPLDVYEELCREKGLLFQKKNTEIIVGGPMTGGAFTVQGDISSQFVSGLLLALPLLEEDSSILLIPPVESRGYIHMTLQIMRQFGVQVDWDGGSCIHVRGRQIYQGREAVVEGDYSNASFFSALNLTGGKVTVDGLKENSLQGDKVYPKLFMDLQDGKTVDISDCPDLGPILMTLAAWQGYGHLTGTHRLVYKESDRRWSMAEELQKCGTECRITENEIRLCGQAHKPAVPLDGHGDHRVVMALSILLTRFGGEIQGAEAVEKSFPKFFDLLEKVGIEIGIPGNRDS